MNYDTIISAAQEYIYQENRRRKTYPNGCCLWDDTLLHYDKAQRCIYTEKAEAVLNALCEFAGIPVGAAINAARIYDRYYERGGTHCIDAERLIRSQMPSQTHAQH